MTRTMATGKEEEMAEVFVESQVFMKKKYQRDNMRDLTFMFPLNTFSVHSFWFAHHPEEKFLISSACPSKLLSWKPFECQPVSMRK